MGALKFFKLQQFQYFAAIFGWSDKDDAFVPAATANASFIVPLVCLFIKNAHTSIATR